MDLGIAGRTALVFGGSRGMGRACARQLALEGVKVTLAARTAQTLEQAAAQITREAGIGVGWVAADLTRAEGREAALAACPAPDILINNADGPLPGDFRDWSRDDWISALDAMMLGPIDMIRRVVDGMTQRGFGRIVNIVSRSVKAPHAELGLSNGARSGLIGFVAGLARQTVRHNVTINNLLPAPSRPMPRCATSRAWWSSRASRSRNCGKSAAVPIRPAATASPRNWARCAPTYVRCIPAT